MKKLYHKDECCCAGCSHDHDASHQNVANDKQELKEQHHDGECGCHSQSGHDPVSEEDEDHCSYGHDHGMNSKSKSIDKVSYRFQVKNLDCANCAMKIENEILKMDGIKKASLSFSTQTLSIHSDIQEPQLLETLNKLVDRIEPGVKIVSSKEKTEKISYKMEFIQLLIGLVGLLGALYLENFTTFDPFIIYVFVYILVGYKVLFIAFRNILKGQIFDENFLMSLATLGAFYIGSYEEAVAVMLFYDLGELLQSLAVHRSRKSISDLMDIHSDTATLLKNGKEIIVSPDDIREGDMIVVRAGERVCVDGVVVKGVSSIDISSLTGESLPKEVEVGNEVLAGSLNLHGLFTMQAKKEASESTVSRILELVENASNKKAKIEKFITRFAKIYTPLVVLAAIIITIVPPLLGLGDFSVWLYRGCTFLVISCPCALVISVPLGLFAGIGAASRKGVLVKGGNYLELLSDMDTLILDKTGTITKGVFKVEEINGSSDLLTLAAYGESYSNHPIARSIVSAYDKEIDQSLMSQYQEEAGYGISALYKGKKLLVGNDKLLQENAVSFTSSNALGSIVYVSYDGIYQGYLVVNDEIKETTPQAIKAFKEIGINQTVMLTGDTREIAEMIGKKVHIDKVHAQLLPQDKVTILEEYLNGANHRVGFVGDGINDAPVLMRADIGIAMGGIGSDAAVEASDIVLMNDDLLSIISAIKIARKTKRILWQNISFSLIVKFVALVLTVFGVINMWMGVYADVGVTLIAIINAMRALRA